MYIKGGLCQNKFQPFFQCPDDTIYPLMCLANVKLFHYTYRKVIIVHWFIKHVKISYLNKDLVSKKIPRHIHIHTALMSKRHLRHMYDRTLTGGEK